MGHLGDGTFEGINAGRGEEMAALAIERHFMAGLIALAEAGWDLDKSIQGGPSIRDRLNDPKYVNHPRHYHDPKVIKRILTVGQARQCPHTIEDSRSSKTKCKHCRKKILKGTPMFGLGELTPRQTIKRVWYHLECAEKVLSGQVQEFRNAQTN